MNRLAIPGASGFASEGTRRPPKKVTTRSDGDCQSGPIQPARGWKGGGRADRAVKTRAPIFLVADDVADFAGAAVVAVHVIALDIAAAHVAGGDVVAGAGCRVRRAADDARCEAETDRRADPTALPLGFRRARRAENAGSERESRKRTGREFGELGHGQSLP